METKTWYEFVTGNTNIIQAEKHEETKTSYRHTQIQLVVTEQQYNDCKLMYKFLNLAADLYTLLEGATGDTEEYTKILHEWSDCCSKAGIIKKDLILQLADKIKFPE